MKILPSITKEFIGCDVTTTVDPTSYTVEFALTAEGTNPGASDWATGEWDGAATTVRRGYTARARVLVGTNDLPLTEGRWACWVRIANANLEVPARQFDLLVVE